MDIQRLHSLDQARALADCMYETYGLTFLRRWVYEPAEILEKNRKDEVRSYIAVEGSAVVGHLAAMVPALGLTDEGQPISAPGLAEVGLSVVRPQARRRGIQGELAMALFADVYDRGQHGAIMKCVTQHTRSQRTAMAIGGVPTALALGAIPRWVVYEGETQDPNQPISTLTVYVPTRPLPAAPLALPEGLGWIADLVDPAGARRLPLAPGPARVQSSRILTDWQPDRQLATLHVSAVGADLIERIDERLAYLAGGHMDHITVYLPGDEPFVAGLGPALAALGLRPCGWLPGYLHGGRDALLLQWSRNLAPDPAQVQVVDGLAQHVKQAIFAASPRPGLRLAS
jgi:hypothetical protein